MAIVPTVHLNGTSRDELVAQLRTAIEAIHAAESALTKAAPHGRDYYPQGSDAIRVAQQEHAARLVKLQEIESELTEIALAIMDA